MKPKTPGFRVLVKPDNFKEIDPRVAAARKAGLEIVFNNEKREQVTVETGVVVELGPSAFKDYGDAPWCKVGDRISYARHGGMYVTDPDNDKETWLVINDEDVVMVWE